jgi:reversibly glycosylated polypeptide/UDP-arabinopyranose mutase
MVASVERVEYQVGTFGRTDMTEPRKTMLVIPTCRPESLRHFFREWGDKGGWDTVCVIEDAPQKSYEVGTASEQITEHYSHSEIDSVLEEDSWIISRRDSAIRCFGFLKAYQNGMDVLTLDDDCFPVTDDYDNYTLADHHRLSMLHRCWIESVPDTRTRGIPYRNLGMMEGKVNVGLWTGVPDLDGPQGLLSPRSDFVPPPGSRLIPYGQYVPVCGMNLYIRHEAIPLFYFPLMGEGQPYKRFDDIWAGIIAKKCMDALGWSLAVGEPFVKHQRASDPFANLIKEAPGIQTNETFWEIINSTLIPPTKNPLTALAGIVDGLRDQKSPYFIRLGQAIGKWIHLVLQSNQPETFLTRGT